MTRGLLSLSAGFLSGAVAALAACQPVPKAAPARDAAAVRGKGLASARPSSGWTYEVTVSARARELRVVASFPAGTHAGLSVDEQAARFVKDVEVGDVAEVGAPARPPSWRAVAPEAGVWQVPPCARARGCVVRYRFALEDAASALDDVNLAAAYHDAIESPPSSWLLRPTEFAPGIPYRFHVETEAGVGFATGVTRAPGGSAELDPTYEADVADLELAPYTVFGTLRTRTVRAGGATFDVAVLPGRLAMDDAALDHWITTEADAITGFYGQFPVKRALLALVPSNGDDVGGKTLASGGASILLDVGSSMRAAAVPDDWVLAHEMTHLAFPSLPRRHVWLEEGLATYVEPLARAKAGIIAPEEVWRGLVNGLPQGQPQAGDRGLDHTPTWGRTYWGGALFCLMADIGIRKATANGHSLEDALRGILRAGGNGMVRWSLERALAEGDEAVGAHVLTALHARMGAAPVKIDLDALWKQLGVHVRGRVVTFDESAPDAAIRRGIAGAPSAVAVAAARAQPGGAL